MTIVNQASYDWRRTFDVKEWPISLTVPGMVMPLEEVVKRYTRGQAVPSNPSAGYVDGDVSYIDKMNVFEKIDMKRKLDARAKTLKSYIDKQNAAVDAEKAKKAFDDAVLAKAAELSKPIKKSE